MIKEALQRRQNRRFANTLGQATVALAFLFALQCCKQHSKETDSRSETQRIVHSCVVFDQEIEGDLFEGGEFVSRKIGTIELGDWANKLDKFLTGESEGEIDIPSVGVLSKVDFLDSSGTIIATGNIYLPDGNLVLMEPHLSSGKFVELNKRVVEIMTAKAPETTERLAELLKEHDLTIERLVEVVEE